MLIALKNCLTLLRCLNREKRKPRDLKELKGSKGAGSTPPMLLERMLFKKDVPYHRRYRHEFCPAILSFLILL